MYLIYGVLVLFAVVLFWSIGLILCRKPVAGWYAKEFMQAYFWAPLGASGLCLGVLMVIKAFLKFSPTGVHMLIAAAILAATVVMYRFLSKWVHPADTNFAVTEAKIIPIGLNDLAQTPAPGHSKPRDNGLKKAA
jgi:O-antigen ligase